MGESNCFGAWSIDQKVFGWILSNIPVGSTILELGSGWATGELARYYKMYSIEDYDSYLDRYDTTYIYAESSKSGWYDTDVLKKELPKIKYDALLIDGPEHCKRKKLSENTGLFNWHVPVIIDDIQEADVLGLAGDIAINLCARKFHIINGEKKTAMVIP